MIYGILADSTVVLHLLWILFLVAGAFWGLKRRAVRYIHFGGMGFAVVSQVSGWYCPLTHLEVWLRALQDPAAVYEGSFIVHYLEKVIYISLPPAAIFVLTLVLAGINTFLYVRMFRRAVETGAEKKGSQQQCRRCGEHSRSL